MVNGSETPGQGGSIFDVFVESMSVKKIEHPPAPGHKGTGTYPMSWEVINPGTVPGPADKLLDRSTATARPKCFFFESRDVRMVPSHFAAAAPVGITDFSNVNIFFHPNPSKAKPPMLPDDYPNLGSWASLFRYAPIVCCQIAEAKKNQIFIMPYVPERLFGTTGDFAKKWRTIVTDIAKLIKQDMTNTLDLGLEIKKVAVSSFSFGIQSSDSFRSHAAASLKSVLTEIWDLDGTHSSSGHISRALRNNPVPKLIQYQQLLPTSGQSFFVGPLRWSKINTNMPTLVAKDLQAAKKITHGNIGSALYYHAATLSKVG